jgi:hypothetical protein
VGFLVGLAPGDCATKPEDTLCTTLPVDSQWSDIEKLKFTASLNNNLEVILNNNNFYDEYKPPTN